MAEQTKGTIAGPVIATLKGAFSQEIFFLGRQAGDWVKTRYPGVSDDRVGRLVGVLIQTVEHYSPSHWLAGPAVETATDMAEQAFDAIWGSGKDKAPEKKGDPGKAGPPKWMTSWLDSTLGGMSEDELESMSDDEFEAMLERFKTNFARQSKIRLELQGWMDEESARHEVEVEVEEEFPPYHAKMPLPKLVEVAHDAGIENVPTSWTRERIIGEIDSVRGVQSPLNEVAKQVKKVASKFDKGAGKLGTRGLAWLERNTDDGGVLHPRKDWT